MTINREYDIKEKACGLIISYHEALTSKTLILTRKRLHEFSNRISMKM